LTCPRAAAAEAEAAAAAADAAATAEAGGGKGGKKKGGKKKGGKGKGGGSKVGTQFVHTLNATACAVPRMIVSILENYQQVGGLGILGCVYFASLLAVGRVGRRAGGRVVGGWFAKASQGLAGQTFQLDGPGWRRIADKLQVHLCASLHSLLHFLPAYQPVAEPTAARLCCL